METNSRQDGLVKEVGWIIGVSILTWALAAWLNTFIEYRSLSIVFLMAVVASGVLLSRSSVLIIASIFCVVHNFFFIPPLYTFAIRDPQDVLTYLIFFVSAFAIGHLTSRLKAQKDVIETREDRAVQLFHLAGAISEANSIEQVLAVGSEVLERTFHCDTFFRLEEPTERAPTARSEGGFTYIPLQSRKVVFGEAVLTLPPGMQMGEDRLLFAVALVGQIAAGLEREKLHEARKKLEVLEQADRLSKALFDSISHELKTPLTTIKGATSALLAPTQIASPEAVRDLLTQVGEESDRILCVVNNMLDMTRLESGTLRPNIGIYDIADVVGPSLKQIAANREDRTIRTRIAEGTRPLRCDAPLIVQALTNILNNSVTHTAKSGHIEIGAVNGPQNRVVIEIRDDGPGLPTEDPLIVFEKFYRKDPQKSGGVGLGLSIAKGFIEAQGGDLAAGNRPEGGARFTLSLPAG